MNRYFTLPVLVIFIAQTLSAQTVGICNQVVAASGQSVEKQGIIYSYTVGETVTHTLVGGNLILTQGFHQPDICKPTVGTDSPPGLEGWQVEIFPNPTVSSLTIRYSSEKNSSLEASVFDLTGSLIFSGKKIDTPTGSHLDCADLPPGTYFLLLKNEAEQAAGTFRFVKI